MRSFVIVLLLILLSVQVSAQRKSDSQKKQGTSVFYENKLAGLKDDDTNEILLLPEYKGIGSHDGLYTVKGETGTGVYDPSSRKWLVKMEYESIDITRKDRKAPPYFIVEKSGLKGLLDQHGELVIAIENQEVSNFTDCLIFKKDGKEGAFIFKTETIFPTIYDKFHAVYQSPYVITKLNGFFSLSDLHGKVITKNHPKIYPVYERWKDIYPPDFIATNEQGKFGLFVNSEGKFLISTSYDVIVDIFDDHVIVKQNGKSGVVTKGDKIVIPCEYDTLSFSAPPKRFSPLIAVRNGRYGLIDGANKVLINFKYDDLQGLNGLYKGKLNGKFQILDSLGNVITKQKFDNAGSLQVSVDTQVKEMAVFQDGKIGYLNASGKISRTMDRVSKARGYQNLDSLFRNFTKVLRSGDDSLMMQFCRDISFDEYTREFFTRTGSRIQDFPLAFSDQKSLEDISKKYFKRVKEMSTEIHRRRDQGSFTYARVGYPVFQFIDKTGILYATYPTVKFHGKSQDYEVEFSLINCDGYWKTARQLKFEK